MMVWILALLFVASIACFLLMVWYASQLLQRFRYISENSSSLLEIIKNYKDHLQKVYDLPMFYGDDTLRGLLQHTKDLAQDLDDLSEIFYLGEENRGEKIHEETEG